MLKHRWHALEADLRRYVRGEVRFDAGSRALYATDGSNYRQTPIAVVIPRDADDAVAAVAMCRRHRAPITARGGGTSLAGQCCNVAVIFDFSKYMNRILSLDPRRATARVQPGVVLDVLRQEAELSQLTFGPDPSTHTHCTLGGMIGNNSCGTHSVMAGRTSENVHELDVLTYDGHRMRVGPTSEVELASRCAETGREGQIYRALRDLRDKYAPLIRARYPRIPRRVSGYNLDELLPERGFHVARALVGTEGTCVTILSARVRLVPSPPHRALVVLGYPDIATAADHVPELMAFHPIALEGIDDRLVEFTRRKNLHPHAIGFLPAGNAWLLVELGADTREEVDAQAARLVEAVRGGPSAKIFDDKREEQQLWKVRESGLGATARVPGLPDTWEGWEDAAVPPERLGAYLRDFRKLLDQHGYGCALYGHFGQGCVHTRIDFDLSHLEGVVKYRAFVEAAADLVVRYGGSLSGEHGDGQSRAELLPKMFGPELVQAFAEFKAIWDPTSKMNPRKVVDPYRLDENLRLSHPAKNPPTNFSFPEDRGSLDYAALRCVGVGSCRKLEGGTMCPSYKVTREEKDSTRGRARLLHEMLTAETIKGGWRDHAVKDALDLCLSCKGCKRDCPMGVDIATYKAEFLSHHYKGRLRPASAYAMGWIDRWSALASRAPRLVNSVLHAPVLGATLKHVAGIAPERQIPRFAPKTFRQWFASHSPNSSGKPVALWVDTFTNHFHPEVAVAATRVLEAAGFHVQIPEGRVCCGRPLYDYGWLKQAKKYLERSLHALAPFIREGIPIVGLEPSCVSVFRDELPNLIPESRHVSKQVRLFSEFMAAQGRELRIPRLTGRALLHLHCHHKSVLEAGSEAALLERAGLDVEQLDSGCCGMAGSFGFEREAGRHEISRRIGEEVLAPAVRSASPGTLIVTSGFSCRMQIAQLTGRRALHSAEIVDLALGYGVDEAGIPIAA
jgi:FAD/FMN-containing dehydrogenase/Fe-S oxidoreductase